MRLSIRDIQQFKTRGERFVMLTVYDALLAKLLDGAGIPLLLVGDSLGNAVLGYGSTIPVTLDDMVRHTSAVSRGSNRALVVGDLPFLSYTTPEQALASARRLMQEAGAQAIKLEGGAHVVPIVQALVEFGVPVMGHLGYTPQSAHQFGKVRVQGKSASGARRLLDDALALEQAGAFAVVLELVPTELAAAITRRLHIPTIGIGAGPECDGQVQVLPDLLGLDPEFLPRHAHRFANLAPTVQEAATAYREAVAQGSFPTEKQGSSMPAEALREALEGLPE